MKSFISRYSGALVNVLCAAINVPFALTGHVFNVFVLGWCSAFAVVCFMEKR